MWGRKGGLTLPNLKLVSPAMTTTLAPALAFLAQGFPITYSLCGKTG